MQLKELAEKLGLAFKGQADYEIAGLRDLEQLSPEALPEKNQLYFVENRKFLKKYPSVVAGGVVLTTESLADEFPRALVAPDKGARLAFIAVLRHFSKAPVFPDGISAEPRIHPTAKIAASAALLPGVVVMEGAVVGENCRIYPGVVIEPFARIGAGTTLYPNVVIGYGCVVGERCILHGAAVIGADGFGFHDQDGARHKIPQIGNVVIEDDVEIGAGTTIDRAAIESTHIGAHTKIDDQVHIGHNCRVGRFVYMAGQSGLAGSVRVGDGSMISGNVAISDHLNVAPGTIVMGMSGVVKDTEPGQMLFGIPARPAREMHRMHSALAKLPKLMSRLRELEEKLGAGVPS